MSNKKTDESPGPITREFPRPQWTEFFDSFSRRHDGWLVTIEVVGPELGAQTQGQDLRLRGISLDTAEASRISIMLETLSVEHLTHMIDRPTHIWLEQTSDGADMALLIESAEDIRTIIRFQSPMRPEQVDGVMAAESPIK